MQGEVRPDGSWCYTEPNGRVHTISAERAKEFMECTHRSATVMVAMLDKLRDAGVLDNTVEAEAQPIEVLSRLTKTTGFPITATVGRSFLCKQTNARFAN